LKVTSDGSVMSTRKVTTCRPVSSDLSIVRCGTNRVRRRSFWRSATTAALSSAGIVRSAAATRVSVSRPAPLGIAVPAPTRTIPSSRGLTGLPPTDAAAFEAESTTQ
jgi:hypothetical protein